MKFRIPAVAVLVLGLSSMANAAIIDFGTYTRDTDLNLDYLDVGLVHDTGAAFQAGIMYDGRTWTLATATQLASTWSAITGLPLSSADILSADNNMGAAATAALINLFDGVTTDVGSAGERVIGDYNLSLYHNYIVEGGLAVHDVFDDSHFAALTGTHGAWLVSASQVPEPASLLLLGTALFGMGLARSRKVK